MKFSFPFFGKKSQPLDQKIAEVSPKEMPLPEVEKPSINWNSVKVDPMPGLEILPEQAEDPVNSLSADRIQNPPFSAITAKDPQSAPHPAGEAITAPVNDLKESPQEELLDEMLPLNKVAVSEEALVEPLEIHDLVIESATVVPGKVIESNSAPIPVSVPELVIETVEDLTPEVLVESIPAPDPLSTHAPVTELVIEAVEDFVAEPVMEIVPESSPVEIESSLDPMSTPVADLPLAAPQPTSAPASPPLRLMMTREDVIAAYKIFLNRFPESFEVIQSRLNSSVEANLIDFALADEFIRRADLPGIVFPIAKKIIEANEPVQSTNLTPN